MKNKLHKLNVITAAIITVILFVAFAASMILYMNMDHNQYDNTIRLLVQEQKNEIEKGSYDKGKYPYLVFDLSGKILYSDQVFHMKIGDRINVQEMLQYDKSFALQYKDLSKESFVLESNGVTTGLVVFLVPKSKVFHNINTSNEMYLFLPKAAGILISVILVIFRTIICNNRILRPLKEISNSVRGIIAGNYDLEVLRTYWKKANENEVGDLSYAFELMRDELKSKQIKEEELKKSQKELITCISHDLKTPISTIKAYSEGLRDNIAKNSEQQTEFIGIIINKTDLLIGMINELLNYSTAQLNQLEISKSELYFTEFWEPLMTEVGTYINQNGFEFTYSKKLPNLLISIDTKRITEVIYNLIENSMKYMGNNDGKISIEAQREDDYVLIKVKDNGRGISSDDIPYVFDMFYRAEKSRSTSIPGSGLGLSICKYIINGHGGEIYCKSSNRKGCEIGFTLPLV